MYYSPKHRGSLSVIYTTDIIPDFVVCIAAHLKKLLTVTNSFVDVCITRHRMQTKCELYQLKKHKVKSHENPKNLERRTKNQVNSKENKLDSMKGKWRSTHRKFQRSTVKRDDRIIITEKLLLMKTVGRGAQEAKLTQDTKESKPSK